MKKLFWQDPYQTTCKAKVVSIQDNKVKLDQTIFYAFSGGQASDEGTINGIKVLEAVKQGEKEDIIDIIYTLEKEPDFKEGDEVEVKIDEKRRDTLRRLHSLAHLVYYFVIEECGELKTIGSNISERKARMDYEHDGSFKEVIAKIQEQTQKFIQEGHDIVMKGDENKEDLRWWTCKDWKMPCGGTHVKNTSEIGQIKLKRKTIGSGKERIEMSLVS
jgi:alanyl-tRNA synthetase